MTTSWAGSLSALAGKLRECPQTIKINLAISRQPGKGDTSDVRDGELVCCNDACIDFGSFHPLTGYFRKEGRNVPAYDKLSSRCWNRKPQGARAPESFPPINGIVATITEPPPPAENFSCCCSQRTASLGKRLLTIAPTPIAARNQHPAPNKLKLEMLARCEISRRPSLGS